MNETQASLADTASVDSTDYSSQAIAPSDLAIQSAVTPGDTFRFRVFAIVMIALIACLAVFHGWRSGYLLAPTDALKLSAPFAKPGSDYVARNEQLLDQTVQFVPWMIYTVDRYRQHQIPLWNPYSQLGAPFMANGQSAIFYPTVLLHLTLPETWSWTLSAALRLFFTGLGMYLLAGRYGLRRFPRLLTAVTFMLCGFNIVWLNHPQMNVMPFLPWAVLLTEMLIQRVTLFRVLGASVIFFIQFLGGHPASCIHLLLTCALVWVLRLLIPQKGRAADAGRLSAFGPMLASGFALFAAVAFGFALAAAQWLPLIEYANHSGATIVRHESLHPVPIVAIHPTYLIGMLFPYANGFPDGVAPFEFRRVTHLPNTNELAPAFIGTLPLILALFAMITLRRQRIVRIWTIMALIAAGIAIKIPGVDHIVRLIPGLNVAQNARLLVVTAFALSILAGVGLNSLMLMLRQGIDPMRLRKILARTAMAVAAIAIIASITLLAAKGPILRRGEETAIAEYKTDSVHEHSLEYVKALVGRVHTELLFTSLRLLIPAFFLGWAAFMLWRHQRRGGHSIACCAWPWCLLAVIDLLAFAIPYNPGAPIETNFPANVATIQKLQELPAYRLAGAFRTLPPETSTAYNLSDLRGYDALAPERYYRWWAHPGIGALPPEAQGYPSKLENPEHPAWQLLNFGYFLTGPDQPAPDGPFKLIDSADDANIYQPTTIRPRAWVAARAEVSDTAQAVLDRIANMEKAPFNPDEVVLLDKEVSLDAQRVIAPAVNDADRAKQEKAFWSNLRPGSTSARPTIQILPPPTKNDEERPEIIRLRVNNASGGFLVLADTYFPGWTATVFDGSGAGREVPILPAYGVLRAVQLPAGSSSVRVEFQYRPWSWRIGVMVSLISLCLLAILIGFTLFRTTFSDRDAGAV
jgi:hypothetical protein